MDGDPFDLVGDVLDGQFRVDAFAGEGDLSVVYRGHHVGVDATVAIKCLEPAATLDPGPGRSRSSRASARRVACTTALARGQHEHRAEHRRGADARAAHRGRPSRISCASGSRASRSRRTSRTAAPRARRAAASRRRWRCSSRRSTAWPTPTGKAVVHLAFSPSNLFLASHEDTRSLKLLDFGVARALNELEADVPDHARPTPACGSSSPRTRRPSSSTVGRGRRPVDGRLRHRARADGGPVRPHRDGGHRDGRAGGTRPRPGEAADAAGPRPAPAAQRRARARARRRPRPGEAAEGRGRALERSAERAAGTGTRSMPAPRAKAPTLSGVAPPPPPVPTVEQLAPTVEQPAAQALAPTIPPPTPPPQAPPQQTVTAKLPPPMPAPPPLPQAGSLSFDPDTPPAVVRPGPSRPWSPPEREYRLPTPARLSPAFIAITASVSALLLAALVILILPGPSRGAPRRTRPHRRARVP